jgi:hypothetical protein
MSMGVLRFTSQVNLPTGCPDSTLIREKRALLIGDDELRRAVHSVPEMVNCWQYGPRFSIRHNDTLRPPNTHTTHVNNDHITLVAIYKQQVKLYTFIEFARYSQ